jgi:hypothetical protein
MSNVEYLKIPTPDESIRARRESATNSVYDIVRRGGQSLKLLPQMLLQAFECEAWKERTTPNGNHVANRDFLEWVTAAYPQGIESSLDIVEAILTSAEDKGEANRARLLLDRALRRDPGAPVGNANAAHKDEETNLYNVQDCLAAAPTGNTAAAGLRRLEKEAEKGNGIAQAALDMVLAGKKSVHKANVECGFRKSTQVDRDVRDRAAREVAELIAEYVPPAAWDNLKANLYAAKAMAIANAFTNLVGQSIMDRRDRR